MRYIVVLLFGSVILAFSRPADILPQEGKASYYANSFHNRKTACGERYSKDSFTAAHRSLPFGTWVRVTNLSNNKEVVVRINDRGPYAKSRIIDLSYAAAKEIDMLRAGVVKVRVEEWEPETPEPEQPAEEESNEGVEVVKELNREPDILIQAGAYLKSENLQKALDELRGLGYENITVLQDITYSRVILGPYESGSEADKAMQKLKEQKIDAFVLKR